MTDRRHIKYFIAKSLIIGFLLIILPASLCWAQGSPAGKITRLEGKVTILRQGKSISAEPSSEIFAADEIQTGPKAMAELILADGSSLHLGPDSQIVLSQYKFGLSEKNPSFIAKMLKGVFVYISGAISKVHPGAVQLETPEATIGIRGTKLVIKIGDTGFDSITQSDVGEDGVGKTIVLLFKDPAGKVGSVTISNKLGQQLLDKEQFAVMINHGKEPSKQFFVDEKTLKKLLPESLYAFIFKNYTPPALPYTEVLRSLNELNGAVNPPDRSKPFSVSTPE